MTNVPVTNSNYSFYFLEEEVTFDFGFYPNDRLAIMIVGLETREPFAKCTVNMPEITIDDHSKVLIKDWSENTGMAHMLWNLELIHEPVAYIDNGHVVIPCANLNRDWFETNTTDHNDLWRV